MKDVDLKSKQIQVKVIKIIIFYLLQKLKAPAAGQLSKLLVLHILGNNSQIQETINDLLVTSR